jgi:predicted transcriptional regulator
LAREAVLERAVMEILWDSEKPMTPAQVRDRLPQERRGAYTTIMTVLVRLWKKDLLDRHREGRAYSYTPRLSRDRYTAVRMESLLESAGNRSSTLARFIQTLSESERQQLRRLLEEDQ